MVLKFISNASHAKTFSVFLAKYVGTWGRVSIVYQEQMDRSVYCTTMIIESHLQQCSARNLFVRVFVSSFALRCSQKLF